MLEGVVKMKWGKGNPLWEWQHRKKTRRHRVKHKKVIKMARRRRSYFRRARRAAGGMLGGMQGKAIAGGKLALAGILVGMATQAAPQFLSNPLIRGGLGLVVPNFKGIPIGTVMTASAITEVASPIVGSVVGGAVATSQAANPYQY